LQSWHSSKAILGGKWSCGQLTRLWNALRRSGDKFATEPHETAMQIGGDVCAQRVRALKSRANERANQEIRALKSKP